MGRTYWEQWVLGTQATVCEGESFGDPETLKRLYWDLAGSGEVGAVVDETATGAFYLLLYLKPPLPSRAH